MPWPHSIPTDLRPLIDGALSKRNCRAAEIWGEVRDWLEAHGVKVPEGNSVEQPPESSHINQ